MIQSRLRRGARKRRRSFPRSLKPTVIEMIQSGMAKLAQGGVQHSESLNRFMFKHFELLQYTNTCMTSHVHAKHSANGLVKDHVAMTIPPVFPTLLSLFWVGRVHPQLGDLQGQDAPDLQQLSVELDAFLFELATAPRRRLQSGVRDLERRCERAVMALDPFCADSMQQARRFIGRASACWTALLVDDVLLHVCAVCVDHVPTASFASDVQCMDKWLPAQTSNDEAVKEVQKHVLYSLFTKPGTALRTDFEWTCIDPGAKVPTDQLVWRETLRHGFTERAVRCVRRRYAQEEQLERCRKIQTRTPAEDAAELASARGGAAVKQVVDPWVPNADYTAQMLLNATLSSKQLLDVAEVAQVSLHALQKWHDGDAITRAELKHRCPGQLGLAREATVIAKVTCELFWKFEVDLFKARYLLLPCHSHLLKSRIADDLCPDDGKVSQGGVAHPVMYCSAFYGWHVLQVRRQKADRQISKVIYKYKHDTFLRCFVHWLHLMEKHQCRLDSAQVTDWRTMFTLY